MNIFDKLKLPFAKKVKQVPVSWVEEGPEHYYVIHHLLFGYSDSTSVPNGYADIFSDAEVHDVLEKARKAVSDMNLSVSSAKALDRITELKAARFFYEKLLARHNANLLSAYRIHSDGDAEQTTYEEQYDRIDRAYGNKLLSLDHNTSFKKGSNGWKEFLQWDKEIKDSMVAKFVALYPYEELAVIQNSKNDGISRRQQLNNRVKYAEACLQDSKWLLRDDFLRLAFLDYLVTEPPENSDKEKKDSMEIIRDFANREGPILERCRLKPYDPDKDALTQDFVRTLENK